MSQDKPGAPRRRGAARLLVVVGATLAALVGCELLLALLGGEIYPPPLFPGDLVAVVDATTDPRIGWKLPPSSVSEETTADYSVVYRANRQGFRSPHDFDATWPGPRLAFLGDSYTFGSGVAEGETFVDRLASRLSGVRCDNYGIGGFGIDQMWMTLRHEALPRRPQGVVLSFIRQDLDRALSAYRLGHVWRAKPTFRLEGDRLVAATTENLPPALERWLVQHSRLHRLWRRAESSLALRHPIGYRWRLHRALFSAIRDDCAAAGVPLLLVHLPVNRRSPAPLYAREFAALGIPFLDLASLLPARPEALYFPTDHHLTAEGHRFVAEKLAEELARRGMPAAR